MVLIDSDDLHNFLADYYDEKLKENPIATKRNLSKIILDFKNKIEELENE